MTVICPIPKSPGIPGRFGRDECQDWHRSLALAADIASVVENPRFLIISAFKSNEGESDITIYSRVLSELAPDVPIEKIVRGVETIEQTDVLRELRASNDEPMVIVSTFLHALRVRYLSRGIDAAHHTAFGLPHPREAITDIILMFAMPIIDACGLREWYLARIEARRIKGVF